jgi:hypothetical protein
MPAREDLENMLACLLQALGDYNDPMQPNEIVQRWTGVTVRADAIARNSDAWNRLAEDSPGAAAIVKALDAATHAIKTADYNQQNSVDSALDQADSAVGDLERLLGT